MMMRGTRSALVALSLLLAGAALHPAAAETLNYNYRRELLNQPIYDSASKKYYEMVDGLTGGVHEVLVKRGGTGINEGPNWMEASKFAEERVYKGVRGRLAVVDNIETHEFLERTFRPQTLVWFGLRYLCSGQLEDSAGKLQTRASFKAWAKNWQATTYGCQKDAVTKRARLGDYMPVAYTGVSEGFQWIAQAPPKRYYYFFVEYPTGKP